MLAGGVFVPIALYILILAFEPNALLPGPADDYYLVSEMGKKFGFFLYTSPVGAVVGGGMYAMWKSLRWVFFG